ncbi:MAG: hypothetical protein GY889_12335, partial [Proteobacteria bacterium]|nr:hypothetical protein [Pseudomonadota bacterium]
GVNQSPLNSVPGAQTTQVNTPLAFTDYRDNLISTSDPDAGLNPVEVTLTATHGTISLIQPDPNGGLTYSVGDGFEDVTMTFTGKLTDINQALSWISFQPEADYVGSDASLTITTDDQGYLGTGGPKVDTDVIPIEVTAVPDFEDSPTWTTFPGALDTSFDTDGMQTLSLTDGIDFIQDMQVLDSGKILAIGAVNNHFGIMRFNADMTLDGTFGTGGFTETNVGAGRHAYTMEFDKQGRILVGGNGYIVRYLSDGQLDTSFGVDGILQESEVGHIRDIAIQADGKWLAFGTDNRYFQLARYLEDGTRDTSFSGDGYQTWDIRGWNGGDYGRGLAIRDDGDILMVGKSYGSGGDNNYFSTFRVNVNGETEGEFNVNLPGGEFVESVFQLPDGKILIIGRDGSGDTQLAVQRRHFDGTLDTTFADQGSLLIPVLNDDNVGYRATLQPDGKILISGHAYNGQNWDLTVVRMSYDGVLDDTFDNDGKLHIPFGDLNDYGYAIASLPDGKILIAGRTGNEIAMVRLYGDSNQNSAGVNQSPLNSVPGAQTTQVNTPLAFTDYRDNLISTSDPDAGLNPVEVTLTATHGTISLIQPDPNGGLTYSVGDGFEDVTMTFTGKLTDINQALSWISFQPEADYV